MNDPVVVVGGGNSAGQAALFLADHARKVQLVVRERNLDEFMSSYLADQILHDPRIELHLHTEVRELLGDDGLEAIAWSSTPTRARTSVLGGRARCSCSSAPIRAPTGWPERSPPTRTAS